MRRKSGKNDIPTEMVFTLFVALIVFSITKDLKMATQGFGITLFIVIVVTLIIKKIEKENYRKKLLNSGMDIVDKMTGEEFEVFLLSHFQDLGYKGDTTSKTYDYGADLILVKEREKIVIQAKRYGTKIGIKAVQEVIGAREYFNADKAIVVTNNLFTSSAKKLAASSVVLWDRNDLLEIMSKANGREIAKESVNQMDINKTVMCKCGSKMVFKTGRYGSFYGCSKYPGCKNTKNIVN